jgi:TPR repeat protein
MAKASGSNKNNESDDKESAEILRCQEAAEQELTWGLVNMGVRYLYGLGVEVNPRKAVDYLASAAISNNDVALFHLGVCYFEGKYIPVDQKYAVQLFTQAAILRNPYAPFNLGVCYLKGTGVAADPEEAERWLTLAANKGDERAQCYLGSLFEHGTNGILQDSQKALKYYRMAAKVGNKDALNNLGNCYLHGTGVAANPKNAIKYYIRAAEKGSVEAQYNLGLIYAEGKVAEENQVEAIKWITMAVRKEDKEAQALLDTMVSKAATLQERAAIHVAEFKQIIENNVAQRRQVRKSLIAIPSSEAALDAAAEKSAPRRHSLPHPPSRPKSFSRPRATSAGDSPPQAIAIEPQQELLPPRQFQRAHSSQAERDAAEAGQHFKTSAEHSTPRRHSLPHRPSRTKPPSRQRATSAGDSPPQAIAIESPQEPLTLHQLDRPQSPKQEALSPRKKAGRAAELWGAFRQLLSPRSKMEDDGKEPDNAENRTPENSSVGEGIRTPARPHPPALPPRNREKPGAGEGTRTGIRPRPRILHYKSKTGAEGQLTP